MSARRKVTVVGAGNVGATCAQVLATRDYADLVLVDIKEGLPQGKALDINQMGAVLGYEPNVTGSNGYEESAGSEVVVITAGLPRSPGMSRDDLVATNEKIVKDVTEKVIAQSPDAILIVVSNPLDAMCHVAKNVSGWPKERVFGMAGILDTARFSTFIAWETGASVKDVQAMVLGGHGDQMVSVVSATTVGGVPLRKLVAEPQIQAMVERTAKGGGELVNLMGTSAWYAPGAAAAQMVDSIMLDEKRVLPCTAYLEGEYGIDGLYMGVPCKLGPDGIEQIIELDLSDDERQALQAQLRGRARSRRRPHDLGDVQARHRRQPRGGHRLRDRRARGHRRAGLHEAGRVRRGQLGVPTTCRSIEADFADPDAPADVVAPRASARPARRARRQSRAQRARPARGADGRAPRRFLHENVRASLLS